MKRFILLLLLIGFVLIQFSTSCHKDKNYLRGRLFVTDGLILDQINAALPFKKVMLSNNNNDTLNYIISDSTDNEGYFVFRLLENGPDTYKLRFSDSIGSYHYYGEAIGTRGQNDIALKAYLDSGNLSGVSISSRDKSDGGVAFASVSVYNSPSQADAGDTTIATLNAVADAYGNFYTYKLKPGQYYVNSQKKIGNALLKKVGEPLMVSKGTRAKVTLTLLPFPDTATLAGASITSMDSTQGYLSFALVSFYYSAFSASQGDTNVAVFNKVADKYGNMTTYEIKPGTYYINSKITAGNFKLAAIGQKITLIKNQLISDTITLFSSK